MSKQENNNQELLIDTFIAVMLQRGYKITYAIVFMEGFVNTVKNYNTGRIV